MTHRVPSSLSAIAAALVLAFAFLAPLGRSASSQESTGPVEQGRTLEAPPPEVAVPQGEELPGNTVVIDVDAPERSLYRIAVPAIRGDEGLGSEGAEVLRNDFRLISLFDVLDPRGFTADLEAEDLGITPA